MTTTRSMLLGDLIQADRAVSAADSEALVILSHLVNSGRIQVGNTATRVPIDTLPRTRNATGVVLHK